MHTAQLASFCVTILILFPEVYSLERIENILCCNIDLYYNIDTYHCMSVLVVQEYQLEFVHGIV